MSKRKRERVSPAAEDDSGPPQPHLAGGRPSPPGLDSGEVVFGEMTEHVSFLVAVMPTSAVRQELEVEM